MTPLSLPSAIPARSPPRRPSRVHSLRWRLPLLLSALVVLMLTTFLWATAREIEDTLVGAAIGRSGAAAGQIAGMLETSVAGVAAANDSLRLDPALRAYLRDPGEQTRQAARAALAPSVSQPFRRVELWDARGVMLLELATPAVVDSVAAPVLLPAGERPAGEGMSELRGLGDQHFFTTVIEIRDDPARGGARLGYLRRFGRLTSTAEGAVRRLVGRDAVVKVGAPDRGVWTDFFSNVDPPPPADGSAAAAADGRRWAGSSAAIAGTPWLVWVGFPRETVVAPARRFLGRLAGLALVFLVVGAAATAVLGVRLTQPLHELAGVAERIAGGDYTRRVSGGRRDEIGRLSDAFNAMARRIEEAHGALRDSHAQTHFALAAARIGVWESRIASGTMICSDSMGLVLGIPPGDLPTTRDAFVALVQPPDRESVQRILEGRGVEREGVFDVHYRTLGAGGSLRWIEGKSRIRTDAAGRPEAVLGVSIDVTDRSRLESQLRQSQKMEAVGQLAGGVAHDFNNLLTSIVAHGNLVLGELAEDQDQLRDDVTEILKAGESAAELTRQLLTFSRRRVTEFEVVDLNAVVGHTEKLVRRLIGENILVNTTLAPDLDAVEADPGQIEQVLVNLAVNARDAMPEGGRLTITTENVYLRGTYTRDHEEVAAGPYVVLSVSDTGTGMDADTQVHLFEPFFTTKPAGKGTGLGLATVFGIVKQGGGHIYVYSEPGGGATFKIYLPATAATTAAAPRPAPARMVGGTETILLVEDSAPVRAVARTILERIGYRVVVAASGEDAIELLADAEAPPDLLISDVIMPGITGPELSRRLAARYPGLRVLFTSGYSGDALDRHGVRDSLFVEKPYTPASLASKVREALARGTEAASGAVPVHHA